MTKNLDLAQLRGKIQAAQSAPSAGLVMKLIQELEEARARHRKAWGRAEAAEAVVQRVWELHKPTRDPFGRSCAVCVGDSRRNPYPCDTIRTLDGGE